MLKLTKCRKCECNLTGSGSSEKISMCSECNELAVLNFFENNFPKQVKQLESDVKKLMTKIKIRKEKLEINPSSKNRGNWNYEINTFNNEVQDLRAKINFIQTSKVIATEFRNNPTYKRESLYINFKLLIKDYLEDYCNYLKERYGGVVFR